MVRSPRRRAQRSGPNPLIWGVVLLVALGVVAWAWFGIGRQPSAPELAAASSPTAASTSLPATQPAATQPAAAQNPPRTSAAQTPAASASTSPAARPAAAPSPSPQTSGWLKATSKATLWSSPDADAVAFTSVPVGSPMLAQGAPQDGRQPIYYPGDGDTRQPGQAWVDSANVVAGTVPSWITTSELDGAAAPAQLPSGAPHRLNAAAPPAVSAQQIAVVDDATGLLLYGLDPHTPEPPASTTKIATALVALRHADSLAQPVKVTVSGFKMAEADGSSVMGLEPGQTVSLRTLLYGLLLPSGNDAAEQLAITLAPSRQTYVDWMNQLATGLGLHDTHFVNPSGVDEAGHAVSAYDLAQLARAAMQNATFRTIVSTPEYKADGFDLQGHNPLLGVYPGTDGVKTGSTDAAGHTYVASVVRDGHRVFVVVMHSDDIGADATALYNWVWATFGW